MIDSYGPRIVSPSGPRAASISKSASSWSTSGRRRVPSARCTFFRQSTNPEYPLCRSRPLEVAQRGLAAVVLSEPSEEMSSGSSEPVCTTDRSSRTRWTLRPGASTRTAPCHPPSASEGWWSTEPASSPHPRGRRSTVPPMQSSGRCARPSRVSRPRPRTAHCTRGPS